MNSLNSTSIFFYFISFLSSSPSCWLPFKGALYWGTYNVSHSGRPCLPWKYFEPKVTPIMFPDENLEEANNFCRNPGMRGDRPFCYVTLNPPMTEDCFVCVRCDQSCVLEDKGVSYAGNLSVSTLGFECISWFEVSKFVQKSINVEGVQTFPDHEFLRKFSTLTVHEIAEFGHFCRNPFSTFDRLWCFTDLPSLKWHYCDICNEKSSFRFAENLKPFTDNDFENYCNHKYTNNYSDCENVTCLIKGLTYSTYNFKNDAVVSMDQPDLVWNFKRFSLVSTYRQPSNIWTALTAGSFHTCARFCLTTSTCLKFFYEHPRENNIISADHEPRCFYSSSFSESRVAGVIEKMCSPSNTPRIMKLFNVRCSGGNVYQVEVYKDCKNKCLDDLECQAFQFIESNSSFNCILQFYLSLCRRFRKKTATHEKIDRRSTKRQVSRNGGSMYIIIRCTQTFKRSKRNMPPTPPPDFDFFKHDLVSTTEKPPPASSDFDFGDEFGVESRFQITPKLVSTIIYYCMIAYIVVVIIIALYLIRWQLWFEDPQEKYDLEVAGKTQPTTDTKSNKSLE